MKGLGKQRYGACDVGNQIFDHQTYSALPRFSLSKSGEYACTEVGAALQATVELMPYVPTVFWAPARSQAPLDTFGGLCSEITSHPNANSGGWRATRDKR